MSYDNLTATKQGAKAFSLPASLLRSTQSEGTIDNIISETIADHFSLLLACATVH